ncbi:Holliday junction branch migration protein RuvA [Mycoplasma procyoni]|uniref:Holliday junction branch migration protein RuvA n=1 Tax=Mycoplasma procyoni TaxID=568784 RepID=UPI00197BB66D|nr:Holliday junction branch migration protein RuvA [Mycoplasma procyoni]MBN3535082.1 Holliday junction branch migration protein RuvA [Mycoplasma procyoni]
MEIYKYGKIIFKNHNYIILESHSAGHIIYVANTERFEKGETRRIYLYHWESEYQKTTYGFENFWERILFEDLITINGIGPKTAINFLSHGWEKSMIYISEGNWEQIAKYPYITPKIARQIVFDFEKKYKKMVESMKSRQQNSESEVDGDEIVENLAQELENATSASKLDMKMSSDLEETLRVLGFKKKQIDLALSVVEPNENFELLVEQAIKIISNAREFRN